MYTEVVVKRKDPPAAKVMKTVMSVLTVLSLMAGLMLIPIALVGAVLFGLLWWKFNRDVDLEFQYMLLDEDFDIAKVIANSKYKPVASIKLGQVVMAAPADSEELRPYRDWKVLDASANDPEQKPYVMACSVKGERRRVLIQVDEKLKPNLKRALGSKMILE